MLKEEYNKLNLFFFIFSFQLPKIIGYNELLRLVHYNRQGEGYNETEKPEKYAKFHYI